MKWKRLGAEKYIKFESGKVLEGIYLGYTERPNPFDEEGESMIYDYNIEVNGQEKTLSSTSTTLTQLIAVPKGTPVKVDMVQQGIKKTYHLYIGEND